MQADQGCNRGRDAGDRKRAPVWVSGLVHLGALMLLALLVTDRWPEKASAGETTMTVYSDPVVPPIPHDRPIDEIMETKEEAVTCELDFAKSFATEPRSVAEAEAVSEEASEIELAADAALELTGVLEVLQRETPLRVLDVYGRRSPKGRDAAVKSGGGLPAGQSAVDRALAWLASVQREDGSWEGKPAQSGLALLCFLAHGDMPSSEPHGAVVQRGMRWLAENVPAGRPWSDGDPHAAYAHGIATYALAEAYGMTAIPSLKQPLDQAVAVIVDGQQPNGGFDYHYRKGSRWDLSVAGWQIQAMKAAYVAGCDNPQLPTAIRRSAAFVEGTAYGAETGRFGYARSGVESPTQSMTGIGAVALQLLGQGSAPAAAAGAKSIALQKLPTWGQANANWNATAATHLYGWYYDTQAMFHHYDRRSSEWGAWNHDFQRALIQNQKREGYWTHDERHHMGGDSTAGKILSTAFCCLQLEVYYRHLKAGQTPLAPIAAEPGLGNGEGSLMIR